MSRRNQDPTYRLHKQSGQAAVTLRDGTGRRRDVLLGKFGTQASRAEYDRVIAEWKANGRTFIKASPVLADMTVTELVAVFKPLAEAYYRHPDGTPTSEVDNLKYALRRLRILYGDRPAKSFDAMGLEAVRHRMIEEGLCRNRINKDVARIKRLFKWAARKKYVPVSVYQELQTVEGLRVGRSDARETPPVKPVPIAIVDKTLPELLAPVAAMVQLQLYTGMRPGEATIMRGIDLDMTANVWRYTPGSDRAPHGTHKTAYRGHSRVILIGPRAQEIIREFLKTDVSAYLFSPADAMAQFRLEQRQNRKSKVQPSQVNRRKRKPKKVPGDHYTTSAYATAIANACISAKVPHWHPHQLRHATATQIRKAAGLDAARAVLGHRSPAITEHYAEIDLNKAVELMAVEKMRAKSVNCFRSFGRRRSGS